jgi:hypothetical protein
LRHPAKLGSFWCVRPEGGNALEAAGVEFIDENDVGRLRQGDFAFS